MQKLFGVVQGHRTGGHTSIFLTYFSFDIVRRSLDLVLHFARQDNLLTTENIFDNPHCKRSGILPAHLVVSGLLMYTLSGHVRL